MRSKITEAQEATLFQRLAVLACACVFLAVIFMIVKSGKNIKESAAPVVAEVASSPLPADTWLNPVSLIDCPNAMLAQGFSKYHQGLDITGSTDCLIHSMRAGRVEEVKNDPIDGLVVIVEHDDELKTSYSHGSGEAFVKTGQEVKMGDPLMKMGQSGKATAVHLHFEITQAGQKLNPEEEMSFYPLERK